MAVPKRRHSKSRKNKRRSHHNVKPPELGYCQQCGTARPTHVVCPTCGHYMGRTLVQTEN